MWPMLFVTVACGAISGFHSLVSSGTSSKQLPAIEDARPIGYGGMIAESALAVLAVVAVCAGLYWKSAPDGQEGLVYQNLFTKSPIVAFGAGYGRLTRPLFGGMASLVGIIVLKTFVMTTLDSATRITRYVSAELLGDTFGISILKNRYASTLLVGLLVLPLAMGSWTAIWPVFGSANQLIAALVLILATAYLLSRGRAWTFIAIPAVLVLVTAIGALAYKIYVFLNPPEGSATKPMLAVICALLIALGLFVTWQGALVVHDVLTGTRDPQTEPQQADN